MDVSPSDRGWGYWQTPLSANFCQLADSWRTETSCWGKNIFEKSQSCCHHSKIAPCVLEGVLFVLFTSSRQMINDMGGWQWRERGSMNREKQEKERGRQTEWEQGAVGLKYPGVGGQQGQQRGSLCSPAGRIGSQTSTHNAWLTVDSRRLQRLKKSEACLAGLFVAQKFSYGHILSSDDGSVGEEQIRWGGGEDRASCCNAEVLEKTNLSRRAMCPSLSSLGQSQTSAGVWSQLQFVFFGLNHHWEAYFVVFSSTWTHKQLVEL